MSALTRLTLVEDEEDISKEWESGIEKDYTTGLFRKRKEVDRLDRAERSTQGRWKEGKRKSEQNEKGEGRKKKRRKYEVLQGDWGESVTVEKVEQIIGVTIEVSNKNDVEMVAGMSENVAEAVSTHSTVNDDQTLKRNSTMKSDNVKKVWTKLRNGLYGWRKVTPARRRCPPQTPPVSRPGMKGSEKGKTSVSTLSTFNSNLTGKSSDQKSRKNIGTNLESRDEIISGCGAALEEQFLVENFENESFRPGLSSKSENENRNSEIGRETDNTVGESMKSSSGVNRGHGL